MKKVFVITMVFAIFSLAKFARAGLCDAVNMDYPPGWLENGATYLCVPELPSYKTPINTIFGLSPTENNGRLDIFIMGDGFAENDPATTTIDESTAERLLFNPLKVKATEVK